MANQGSRKVAPCGTVAAYQRHHRRGEEPCIPCLQANRKYHAENRVTNPNRVKRERAYQAAYGRATSRLVGIYSTVFEALLAEERAR